MQPWSPSLVLVLVLGLCCLGWQLPSPAIGSQMGTAGSLKIWEKSWPFSPPGGAGNSLWCVHSSGVRVKTCSAGSARASSHNRFADGLFLLESEEKVVLWLFVMEGSFPGGKGIPEVELCQTLSPSAQAPVAVLTLLHGAVAPTLERVRDSVVLG